MPLHSGCGECTRSESEEARESHAQADRGCHSNGLSAAEAPWLDVEHLAETEVTSEDALHPIEAALRLEGRGVMGAAEPGAQTLRLRFDDPECLGVFVSCSRSAKSRGRRSSSFGGRGTTGAPTGTSSASTTRSARRKR